MRLFSLFKRSSMGLYYAQIRIPDTGERLSPRALSTRDKDEALVRVGEWLRTVSSIWGRVALCQCNSPTGSVFGGQVTGKV